MPAVLAMRRLAPGIDTAPTMTDTALRAFVTRETAPKFPTLDEARLAYGRLMMDARAAGQNTTAIDTELKRAQVIIKHAQGINQLLSQGYVCGMSVDEATRYFPDCKIEKVTKKGASCPAGTVAYTTDGLRDPPPVAAGNTYCHPATSSGRRPKYMFIGPPYTTGGGFVPTTLQYYMSYL
jgi:hypothetical protein